MDEKEAGVARKVKVDAQLLEEAFALSGFATEREAADEGLRLYIEWRKHELIEEAMQKPITDRGTPGVVQWPLAVPVIPA